VNTPPTTQNTYVTIVSDLHRVGGGYSIQFITKRTDDGQPFISCEWSPRLPSPREVRRKVDLRRYNHALALFTSAVAAAMVNLKGKHHG